MGPDARSGRVPSLHRATFRQAPGSFAAPRDPAAWQVCDAKAAHGGAIIRTGTGRPALLSDQSTWPIAPPPGVPLRTCSLALLSGPETWPTAPQPPPSGAIFRTGACSPALLTSGDQG